MQMEVPTDTKYREGPERSVFYQKVMLELEAVPGVRSAGLTQILPLDARVKQEQFVIEGDPPLPGGVPSLITDYAQVSPHYFRTMGIALRHGRFFEDNDNRDAPPVAVISEALAERHFSGRNPLGRRLEIHGRRWEIVGVAGDVKHAGLERSPQPTVYLPCYQAAGNLMSVVVRTDGPPERFVQAVKEAVWRVDKDQPLYRIRTMDQVVSGASVAVRMTAVVLGIFAALAVLMAAIGIYGVMSYSVSQRRQEMGVRMAVGARAADVLQLVVRQGVSLAAAGVALGLLAALALTRLLGTLLFGVSATDPLVLASVAAMLVAVSAAASYLPARRATRMDATVALHYE
jgi:putative ABC transport system permease protein